MRVRFQVVRLNSQVQICASDVIYTALAFCADLRTQQDHCTLFAARFFVFGTSLAALPELRRVCNAAETLT